MRILAIRGENLASLAAPFEIDLSASPLAGSGIFAITGETGAGKSTLLDTLCLALYGEYPRISVERRENAPDPSGDSLTASDSRAILRRGAGSGYAEVDFVGRDGRSYRARWVANRARGKAKGRLQPEQRSLVCLDDESAVASGKSAVLAAIQERTDLTFDQFRRTVLLAQGEFDAFLLAAENERAELLEKITGTQIYAAISVRVHQATQERQRTVDQLEQRRSATGLLDEVARHALIEERDSLSLASAAKEEERHRLNAELEHLARIASARRELARAEGQAAVARRAQEDAAADYRDLAELDAVEPLRLLAAERAKSKQERREAEVKAEGAQAALAAARTLAADKEAQLDGRRAEDEAAEEAFKRFGPVWTEAERLDADLASASAELERAESEVAKAAALLVEHEQELSAATEKVESTAKALQEETSRLEGQAARAILADRLDDAKGLLQKRSQLAQDCTSFVLAGQDAEEAIARLRAEITDLSEQLDARREERRGVVDRLAADRAALAALDGRALQARDSGLAQFIELLREAASVGERHAKAVKDRERAEVERLRAGQEASEATARKGAAEADRLRDTAARAEIAPLGELAEKSVSSETVHLRSLLVPDAPCPVCGSVEHPYRASEDGLDELVATLRRRREELDESLQRAEDQMNAAVRSLVKSAAQLNEADRLAASAGHEIAATTEDYAGRRGALEEVRVRCGLGAPLPQVLGAATKPALDGLVEAARKDRSSLEIPLREATRLRHEIDDLQAQQNSLSEIVDGMSQKLVEQRQDLHAAELDAEREASRVREVTERLESITREILPYLKAADLMVEELDLEPDDMAERLTAMSEGYRELRERVAGLEDLGHALAPQKERAGALREGAASSLRALEATLEERRAVVERKRSERAGLLEGEATSSHRSRINEARRKAREALATVRDEQTEAATGFRAAEALCGEASSSLKRARERDDLAQRELQAACTEKGLVVERAVALLAEGHGTRSALRDRLEAIDRRLRDAEVGVTTRREDLDRLLPEAEPEGDADALTRTSEALSKEIGDLHQGRGAVDAKLERDDEARRSLALVKKEIDEAKAVLAVWQEVDAAIGSASGDRFRRFVQGITLDHLVGLANEQLSALNPRFQLTHEGLALHVIDREMGDEVRGTRSLSGGERFLVALALALALASLEGRDSFVDTLFIDEGFGSLDSETLDMAIDALETLQSRGRRVCLITHVAALIDRIAVQVRVEKRGSGRSAVRIVDAAAGLFGTGVGKEDTALG